MEIGAQLYTVRLFTQNETDFARTLEQVSKIGYRSIQLSALGPIPPKRVKALCDDNGLKIVLSHNHEKKFLSELDNLIEEHQIYECKYVGLGSLPERYRDITWLNRFAQDYEESARKLKDAGLMFMYHNHAFEFSRLPDGRTIMETLLDMLPVEIMGITADTYWLQFAGVDVISWLNKHAKRLHCVHLKDTVPHESEVRMAPVGSGNMNFEAILDSLDRNGVTEHILVEQDHCYGKSPFDCLKMSYDYIRSIGYK